MATSCGVKKVQSNIARSFNCEPFSNAARRLFLKATELVFQLGHAAAEAFQNLARLGGNGHAVLAMMARGGAAFDGIIKFLAAGAAGARALAGLA